MNLLVIGNGFDLAHDLPTKYSDFLDFMVLCINKFYPKWRYWNNTDIDEHVYNSEKRSIERILDDLNKNKNTKVEKIINDFNNEQLKKFLKIDTQKTFINNQLLRYFICIYAYKKQLTDKFNWIDIEDEIEKLLMQIESSKLVHSKELLLSVNIPHLYLDKYSFEKFYFPQLSFSIRNNKYIPEEKLKSEILTNNFEMV